MDNTKSARWWTGDIVTAKMTAQLPDPRDFNSWEDAFQHPLPAVRKLEQQLRSNAVENREKLRSLVGYVHVAPASILRVKC